MLSKDPSFPDALEISEMPDSPLLPEPVMSQMDFSVEKESSTFRAPSPFNAINLAPNVTKSPIFASSVIEEAQKKRVLASKQEQLRLLGPLAGEVESKSYFKCCFNRRHQDEEISEADSVAAFKKPEGKPYHI